MIDLLPPLAVVFVLLVAAVGRGLDGRWVSPPLVLTASLLLPPVVFGIRLDGTTWCALFVGAACFVFGYSIVRAPAAARRSPEATLHEPEVRVYLISVLGLFLVAQMAFAINFRRTIHTFGVMAYFTTGSKDIEDTFGAHTTLNYLFFLNICAAALAAYVHAAGRYRWLMRAIAAVAVFELIFTGIKSTFVFGAGIVTFVTLLAQQERVSAIIWRFALLCGAGAVAFAIVNFGFASGRVDPSQLAAGMGHAVERYIIPNYQNLQLELRERAWYTYGKYTFWFITKLTHPGLTGYFQTGDFYLVDSDNNMGTFLREYFVDFGAVGICLLPLLLGMASGGIVNAWRRFGRPAACIATAVAMTACAFAFFGNQFVRLQFIYVVMVLVGLDWWLGLRRARKAVEAPA